MKVTSFLQAVFILGSAEILVAKSHDFFGAQFRHGINNEPSNNDDFESKFVHVAGPEESAIVSKKQLGSNKVDAKFIPYDETNHEAYSLNSIKNAASYDLSSRDEFDDSFYQKYSSPIHNISKKQSPIKSVVNNKKGSKYKNGFSKYINNPKKYIKPHKYHVKNAQSYEIYRKSKNLNKIKMAEKINAKYVTRDVAKRYNVEELSRNQISKLESLKSAETPSNLILSPLVSVNVNNIAIPGSSAVVKNMDLPSSQIKAAFEQDKKNCEHTSKIKSSCYQENFNIKSRINLEKRNVKSTTDHSSHRISHTQASSHPLTISSAEHGVNHSSSEISSEHGEGNSSGKENSENEYHTSSKASSEHEEGHSSSKTSPEHEIHHSSSKYSSEHEEDHSSEEKKSDHEYHTSSKASSEHEEGHSSSKTSPEHEI
ncbi:hypothetical protein AYI68_g281, partial [Smittium mucronatum]